MQGHPALDRLAEAGVKLGLDRTRQFLHALGEPQLRYPVLHVAGTNGKGSVCSYLTATLVAAGYRVGTYLSPHLEHINERILLDGRPIDDPRLTEAIEAVDRHRHDWAQRHGHGPLALTWFEMYTAVAFYLFAQHEVDIAVIEVGLGGRLDCTNVVQPVVCGITSIGWDHMDVLGDTIEQIAMEKAGILQGGVPAAVGPVSPAALESIRRVADARGAPLWWSGPHLRRERRPKGGWVITTPDGAVGPTQLAMEGAHQGANASVAVGMLHLMRHQGFAVPDEAILTGLQTAKIQGRIEQIRPGLILDGAHNVEGTTALAAWLSERPRPSSRILLFGMGAGRDARAILEPLLPHVDEVVLVRCDHPKSLPPLQLAALIGQVEVALSDGGHITEALPEVYAEAEETIVAGSLYLVGDARAAIGAGLLDG